MVALWIPIAWHRDRKHHRHAGTRNPYRYLQINKYIYTHYIYRFIQRDLVLQLCTCFEGRVEKGAEWAMTFLQLHWFQAGCCLYICVCVLLCFKKTNSNFPRPRITMDFALPRPLSTVISGPYKLSMAIDGQSRQSTFVCLSLSPIFLKRSAAS